MGAQMKERDEREIGADSKAKDPREAFIQKAAEAADLQHVEIEDLAQSIDFMKDVWLVGKRKNP